MKAPAWLPAGVQLLVSWIQSCPPDRSQQPFPSMTQPSGWSQWLPCTWRQSSGMAASSG